MQVCNEVARLSAAIATAVARARGGSQALREVLRLVCQATGWPRARAWLPAQSGRALLAAEWNAGGARSSAASPSGACDASLRTLKPAWDEAERCLAVPALEGAELVAVLELFSAEPQPDDGEWRGAVACVAAELGGLLRLRESAQREQAVLAEGFSHQARNLLFGILATLDALEAQLGPDRARDHLKVLRSEVGRLDRMLRDVWEYARPAAEELAPLPLAPVLAEAVALCREQAEQSGVRLALSTAPSLPRVQMDRPRLTQALRGLIEESLSQAPRDGEVSVQAAPGEAQGRRWIVCAVSGTRPALSDESLQRIFQPFFARHRGTTGLALSIAQRIAEQHGGMLTALQTAGGCSMLLRLPPYEVGSETPP